MEGPNGEVPYPFTYRLLDEGPTAETDGGKVYIADSTNFKVSKTIASALVVVEPGAMRELHWHPNTHEWQYYISGKGRMTVLHRTAMQEHLTIRPGMSVTFRSQWATMWRIWG